MGFRQALRDHGEVIVELENDRVAELHLDAQFSDDGATNRTLVTFTDEDNEEHSFYADSVVNYWTHPSGWL